MKKIYNLLFEAEGSLVDTPEASMKMTQTDMKARKSLDSIDDQVDALILRYESASIKEDDDDIASLKESSLRYLFEQDDDAVAEEEADEELTGDDDGTTSDDPPPEPSGSEEMDVDEPAESQEIPNLDLDAFAARTVRLIKNYKSLLRMEEAIGNRVKHFLDENYGDKFVQRYLEILESQYGLVFSEFEEEDPVDDDNFAVGAFAGGTGGLGGGG